MQSNKKKITPTETSVEPLPGLGAAGTWNRLEGWICTTTLPREALYPHLAEGHDLPKATALQRARAVFEALSVCPQSPDRLFLQHTSALRACLVAQTLSHSGFLGGLDTKMISHT